MYDWLLKDKLYLEKKPRRNQASRSIPLWYCMVLCVSRLVMARRHLRRGKMFGEWAPSWYLLRCIQTKLNSSFILEPSRSASIPVGLQSKARQKMSSSNPQLNSADEQQPSYTTGKWVDEEEEPRMAEVMNLPGNRSSMAESRPSSLAVPGLVLGSSNNRKVYNSDFKFLLSLLLLLSSLISLLLSSFL